MERVQRKKIEGFSGFCRKAVAVIPTFENLRKRTNEKKQREGIDIPFDVLASMKCMFVSTLFCINCVFPFDLLMCIHPLIPQERVQIGPKSP